MSKSTSTPVREGVTYILTGARHYIAAARSHDRVRIMRVAQDKGATNITTVRNGRIMGE